MGFDAAERESQIRITGMSCQHCVQAVTRALRAVPGVTEVRVQLGAPQATVRGRADVALLLRAIEGEGYGAVAQAPEA
jgi:copper chaperone